MAMPILRIIPTIVLLLSEVVVLVRNFIRDRVLQLQNGLTRRLGESCALLAKLGAAEPRIERGRKVINSTTMILKKKEISFSIQTNNFSHFLISRDPAFYAHSDFDDSCLPFHVHSSRHMNSHMCSSWNMPSEDSPSISFSMNISLQ